MRPVTDAEREQRFRAIAELVLEPARRYLLRRADAAMADDVLSETLLVCWRRLDELPAVSPEGLLAQEQAFAARVIAVDGGVVTLEVTERFAGDVADRVEVPQVDALDSDLSSVPFELGQSYLVSAGDATIRGCGLSGPDSAQLRALDDAAFGG